MVTATTDFYSKHKRKNLWYVFSLFSVLYVHYLFSIKLGCTNSHQNTKLILTMDSHFVYLFYGFERKFDLHALRIGSLKNICFLFLFVKVVSYSISHI